MTMFLTTAMTCAAAPLRIRLASSRSVPSRTPCRPFSIPQWPRLTAKSTSAVARGRGRLVIPSTTSVSTFAPVRRCRSRRKTCAQPGQSEPRYSPSDDVTSIARRSIRPCPLSTVPARSISAWCRAAWRGGKAGLWLGEGGRDVPGERRLVVLHRQDIIAAPVDDGRADIAMGEQGIAGDDLAADRQHPQQLQRRLVLVGLGIDPQLGQDRLDLRGIGGDQVDPGGLAVAAAPGGLAVAVEVVGVGR